MDTQTIDYRRALAAKYANKYGLRTTLVCAVIEQESSWNQFAIRPESHSGFASRYGDNYAKIVIVSGSKNDDRWFSFPDIFYCSFGLMQVIYAVAIEMLPGIAGALPFPTQLCDPDIGVDIGCSILAQKIKRAGSERQGLLNWNGGGDPHYPDKVYAREQNYDINQQA